MASAPCSKRLPELPPELISRVLSHCKYATPHAPFHSPEVAPFRAAAHLRTLHTAACVCRLWRREADAKRAKQAAVLSRAKAAVERAEHDAEAAASAAQENNAATESNEAPETFGDWTL